MDEERKAALLQQIGKKQNGRTNRKADESLQDKLRSLDRDIEEIGGSASGTSSESGEGTSESSGDAGLGGNGGGRLSFSDGSTDESDSGSYQDSAGIEGNAETTRPVEGTEKKPGGLNIIPSKREKKTRDEEARRKNAEKQRAFRARKKAATSENAPDVPAPAKRSVLDLLPNIGKEKAEKAVRKAFSEAEARVVKPMLVSAMLDYFSYADELLYATVKGHPRVEIWSTIDDEECGILADVLVARGKRSAAGAAQIQAMIDVHKNLKVGMILAPRFYQTFRVYMDSGGMSLKN